MEKQKISPLTEELIEAIRDDLWPSAAVCVDFGIRTTSHLGALQYAYKCDDVSAEQLDAALGKGAEIQKLISQDNPYRMVVFVTDWDNLPPEEEDEDR